MSKVPVCDWVGMYAAESCHVLVIPVTVSKGLVQDVMKPLAIVQCASRIFSFLCGSFSSCSHLLDVILLGRLLALFLFSFVDL